MEGQKFRVLDAFFSSAEINTLHQSELVKSSGYFPQLRSLSTEFPVCVTIPPPQKQETMPGKPQNT